jgi:hypothetical protein
VIRILCPNNNKHLIARVDVTPDGKIKPRGIRHGLSWNYADTEGHSRLRVTCPKARCTYDKSCEYERFRDQLARAAADGHTEYVPEIAPET